MLLSAEQLSINFGSRQLLQDVDFYLNEGDKTGVIGINGTGKSTFLKVLAGLVQPDSGRISHRPNLQVSYLPQNPEMDDDRTILEQVFASMPPQFRALNEYEAKAMLTKLGLGETDRRIGTLSGGERRRAALCAALIHPADVLVLDEPTNDLDVTTLSILEDYLQSFPGPIITVSHDRFFLDKMADTILEVRPEGRVDIFTGNWSDWARKRRPAEEKKPEKSEKTEKTQPERPREKKLKFSYNEQREFETIDAVLAELEEKLAACRRAQEACGSDYVRLQELTDEQERLSAELDEKTERWVYLNDLKEKIDAQNSQGGSETTCTKITKISRQFSDSVL